MRRILVGIIRTCRFYGPQFSPIDVSISLAVREYTVASVERAESNLLRIFTHFLGNGFFQLNVYYNVVNDNEYEYMMEDYNVFISAADLISFL